MRPDTKHRRQRRRGLSEQGEVREGAATTPVRRIHGTAQRLAEARPRTVGGQYLAMNLNSSALQSLRQGLRGGLAAVAGAIDLQHGAARLPLARGTDLPGDQFSLEQHSFGEIKRVEVSVCDRRHLDIRKQAGQLFTFTEIMDRPPHRATDARQQRHDRFTRKVLVELLTPACRRTGEFPEMQLPVALCRGHARAIDNLALLGPLRGGSERYWNFFR